VKNKIYLADTFVYIGYRKEILFISVPSTKKLNYTNNYTRLTFIEPGIII